MNNVFDPNFRPEAETYRPFATVLDVVRQDERIAELEAALINAAAAVNRLEKRIAKLETN